MGPYEEIDIGVWSVRDSVLKRPTMLLGTLDDGTAYAGVIRELVQATLSWQIGANVGVELKTGNAVELCCYSGLPEGKAPYEHRWSRPISIVTTESPVFGGGHGLGHPSLEYFSVACRQMKWEIRDSYGSGSAIFEDGLCTSASRSAPALPSHLCLRVSCLVGSSAIEIAPATVGQVANAIRYMDGPAEADYWGRVTISDLRTNEQLEVMVTNYPGRLPC